MRVVLSFLLWAGFAVEPAAACDLEPTRRPAEVAGYVEAARACLRDPPEGFGFRSLVEQEIFKRVNAERVRRGLPALAWRDELRPAARLHSLDMAVNGFFDHAGANGRTAQDRIAAFDRRLFRSGSRENIAAYQGPLRTVANSAPAATLHRQLMDSPGHRANILAEGVTHAVVGVVATPRGYWVTQVFVAYEGELDADAPLQLKAGGSLDRSARLTGWTAAGFLAAGAWEAPAFVAPLPGFSGGHRAPPGLSGDIVLHALGERPGPKPRTIERILLAGPAMTVRER